MHNKLLLPFCSPLPLKAAVRFQAAVGTQFWQCIPARLPNTEGYRKRYCREVNKGLSVYLRTISWFTPIKVSHYIDTVGEHHFLPSSTVRFLKSFTLFIASLAILVAIQNHKFPLNFFLISNSLSTYVHC